MDNPRNHEKEYRMLLDKWAKMKKLVKDDFAVDFVKCSSNVKDYYEVSESIRQVLEHIMEALIAPNINMIGVRGKDDDNHIASLLQRVIRRGWRDNLFGMIVMISIRENPDIRRIQEEIAHEIGCSFQRQVKQDKEPRYCCGFNYFQFHSANTKKFATENAEQLFDKIRSVPKILFILRDVRSKLDLAKLGIPFGVDHQGCKLILISESDDILSNHMNAQCTFMF
ncbi:hypothetical protein Lal_00011825 [Lupinus albus]|uniref:Uncharacterized protein n=1 Tax=Lupinus albus TaxID=3870 RepID=A0A6A4QDP5_LUPAL|nr:hypothetical protein Lalb_Chr06g0165581 [Lupinus albus]KAF1880766.1 hypothetical protein Lal_00011825 [Lupinus albus]